MDQGFNLPSKRMCVSGSDKQDCHFDIASDGWGLPLEEEGEAAIVAVRILYLFLALISLVTSGQRQEIELEIVGNRGLLFLLLVAFIFSPSPHFNRQQRN